MRSATRAARPAAAAEMPIGPLGIIPDERLQLMPRSVIPRHEFCFWLHDQIARLLVEASHCGQIDDWNEAVSDALQGIPDAIHPDNVLIAIAEAGGIISIPMKIDILSAVLSDTLHFVYEALRALEKRKFNVAFSLLRKPFSENLIILARLAANDDDFISSFADGSLQQKQITNIDASKRVELFESAISKLPIQSPFSGALINDIIFNKNMPNGLQIRMQQATHLITSHHPSLLTPKLDINRIFSNQYGDENFSAYDSLPVIIFFILQIVLYMFSRYLAVSEKSTNEILVRASGIYTNIYEGRLDSLSRYMNVALKGFFKCEWCVEGNAKIRKAFSADFYLRDQIFCTECRRLSHTPLTYLLRSGKLNIIEKERKFPSEYERLFLRDADH
ncbi:hypothetical protein AAIH46_20855 [Rhizobium sp. 0TCS1.26]|uniref:hypothetical protein n=1 Tax=Rhizobium sp. 0TCS1.26 TaxID=3142623 RepID=UPI003D28A1C8